MNDPQLVLVALILGLAFWKRDAFLYLIASPAAVSYGFEYTHNFTTNLQLITGIVVAIIGAYCLWLGIDHLIRPGHYDS